MYIAQTKQKLSCTLNPRSNLTPIKVSAGFSATFGTTCNLNQQKQKNSIPMWLVPNWSSHPSCESENGVPSTPALFLEQKKETC